LFPGNVQEGLIHVEYILQRLREILAEFAPCQGLPGTLNVILEEIAQVPRQARKKGGGDVVLAGERLEGDSFPQDGIYENGKKRLTQDVEDIRGVGIKPSTTACTDQTLGMFTVRGILTVFPDYGGRTGQIGTFQHKRDENIYKLRGARSSWL